MSALSSASPPLDSASAAAASAAAAAASAQASITQRIRHKGEQQYPKDIWYMVLCTICIAMIFNILSIVWAWKRRYGLKRPTPTTPPSSGSVSWRRLPGALITAGRIVAFRWRLPSVNMYLVEVFLTLTYLLGLLLWELVNTQHLTLKLYSDRGGHIIASQIPLIVLLSSRNSAIEFLTGISHEKLRLMHRAVARSVLVIVWIHGWTRVVIDAPAIVEIAWKRLGLASGILYTVMVLISVAPVRKRYYEYFLAAHIFFSVAFLIMTTLHAAEPGFVYYVWPAWILWAFDHVCRWLRYTILTNFHAPNDSPADLELITDDAVRVTVRRWVPFGWRAGQHMFISMPHVGPIESHPFTIATLPEGKGRSTEMTFIIRLRDGPHGFTHRLREYVLEREGSCRLPVFLDGPYGSSPDMSPYSTCVFIAGGSGVTYTMPRLRRLLNSVTAQKACAKRIVWVWVVRRQSHLTWLASEMAKVTTTALPEGVELSIAIYVTSETDSPASLSVTDTKASPQLSDLEKEMDDEKSHSGSIKVVEGFLKGATTVVGKPDLHHILEDAVTNSTGPVSVDVSGPQTMVSSIRTILSGSFASPMAVLKGTPMVELHVESFTM